VQPCTVAVSGFSAPTAAALRVFLSRDGKAQPLQEGKTLRPGDQLRVAPSGGGHRWLLMVYVDSEARRQVVYPWDGSRSDAVPREGEALDGSLVLDDSTGREQLIGFFSDERLSAGDAQEFLRAQGDSVAGGPAKVGAFQAEVVVIELTKEAR